MSRNTCDCAAGHVDPAHKAWPALPDPRERVPVLLDPCTDGPFLLRRAIQRAVVITEPILSDPQNRADRIRRRTLQFEAGRRCAAELLAELGSTALCVGVNEDRSPSWPPGYVGSITHTDRLACVAVSPITNMRAIGIDVEERMSIESAQEIESLCMLSSEVRLSAAVGDDRALLVTLCFSAKEALFKCLYPVVKSLFGFDEVEILQVDPEARQLAVRLLSTLSTDFKAGDVLQGRCRWDARHVFTSFEIAPVT
jgi:4'-phosphopantetheinyl transferase EntD